MALPVTFCATCGVMPSARTPATKLGTSNPLSPPTVAAFPALEPKLPARGASLSGGQQQLLALARALATQPRLLLLDEATEGIQPSIVAVIRQKVQDINRNRGVAVLLVEQNIEFAVALASRTYIMNQGQIVLELAPQDVLRDQTVQREYLGV